MKLIAIVVLAACTHAPVPQESGSGGWETWSHDKKLAFMKATVMPAERNVFMGFEPVRYEKMTCETCHGASAREGRYTMPNPDLPKLVGGKQGFEELARVQPETLKFMQSVVVPETAKLLGVKPFDFETHTGFSCYQCHVKIDVKP